MISEPFRNIIPVFLIMTVMLLFSITACGAIYMDEDFEGVEPFVDRKFPVLSGTAQPVAPLVKGINLRAFSNEQAVPPVLMQTMGGTVVAGREYQGTHFYRLSAGQRLAVAPGQFPHRNGVWFRLWQFAVSTDLVTVKLPPGTQIGHFKIDYSNDSIDDLKPDVTIQLILRVNNNSGVDLVCANKNDAILGTLNGDENNWLVVTIIAMNKVTNVAKADTTEGWIAYDPLTKVFKGPQPRNPIRPEKIPFPTGVHIYVNGPENRKILLVRSRDLGNSWGNEDGGVAVTSEIGWEFAAENGGMLYLDNLYWEARGVPNLENGIDMEQNTRLGQFGDAAASADGSSPSSKAVQPEVSNASSPFSPVQSGVPGAGSTTFPLPLPSKTPAAPDTPSTGIVWYNDYQEAVKAGQMSGRCIILFFHSPLSKMSRDMEQLLNEPSVKGIIKQYYVGCKLITSKNFKVSDYYQVFKAPTLVFLDSRGYSRGRIDDLVTPDQLLTELDRFKQ
jgi:hypothetical protein